MKNRLTPAQTQSLLTTLKSRFEKHPSRHKDRHWPQIQQKPEANPEKCRYLQQMENSGGEPDVIGQDNSTGEVLFCDCSPESPKERRNCYDKEAQLTRKEHAPDNNALDMAAAMGIDLLTEKEYRSLQELGKFDEKTSSWLLTPPEIRQLGGAIFRDRRYNRVFTYHNGAQSYYAARGFRGILRL